MKTRKLLFIFYCISNTLFAQQPALILPIGHTELVFSSQYSLDGKKILTLSTDGTAKLWEAGTGKLLKDFKEGGDASRQEVLSAVFCPGGKQIALNYEGHSVILELESGKQIWSRVSGELPTKDIKKHFSPDGKNILLLDFYDLEKTVTIYNSKTLRPIGILKGHRQEVNRASYSPDGRRIVTASADSSVKIWDAFTLQPLLTINGQNTLIEEILFSPDSKIFILRNKNYEATVFNVSTGKKLVDLTGFELDNSGQHMEFSPDGKLLLKLSNANEEDTAAMPFSAYAENINMTGGELAWKYFDKLEVWNIPTGKSLYKTDQLVEFNNASFFSPDGKKIVTPMRDGTVKIREASTGKILFSLTANTAVTNIARFSPDGKKIVTGSMDNSCKLWDAITGKLITTLTGHTAPVNDARFSPNGKNIITASGDHTALLWNTSDGQLISSLKGRTNKLLDARFSSDSSKIIFYSTQGQQVWDFEKGSFFNVGASKDSTSMEKLKFSSHARISPDSVYKVNGGVDYFNLTEFDYEIINTRLDEIIIATHFSPDSRKLLITLQNNTVRLFDIQKRKFVCTFISVDSTDYFAQVAGGYYLGSKNATKLLHYVTKDLKVITFEQLDVKYNRPDKVLEAIGSTDTALIKSYRKAWEKRIKKLSIDTTAFRDGYSVPEADFPYRDAIEYEQKTGLLKLTIKGNDGAYKLDRFNVWVNEIPLYGQRGISLRKKNKNNFDSTININLSQGENKIETSITNINGTESYRMPLLVNYIPEVKQKEQTYFIGIGIDQFNDNKYNLKYSTKDIRDLSIKLKEKYKDIIIDTLFNEKVIISNIKALKKKLLQTSVNDKVIISYSGHGMLSKDFDYFLSTYAVNFEKPEENGLPYDELESLLDSIPARKKLMLIDACHSGEVDKDDLVALDATDKKLIKGFKPVAYKKDGQLGLQNSFELMQSLFVNVGKSTGATIISAAAGTEFALEGVDNLPNGVFTYCILEAMKKNKTMKISELKKTVGERVVEITKGLQKPTSRNETIAVDWEIW